MLDRTAAIAIHDPAVEADAVVPIVARGITIEIDGRRLLDSLDIEIGAEGVTAVMGPNGAGKSLLVRVLHGLIEPTRGHVECGGRPLDAAVRARQAMVFQKAVLLRRSVAANIDFVLSLKGRADAARRDAILEQAGLLAHARQPARLLSGGEQQRLALARALATEPDVLFLDEPTASLDPGSVLRIEGVIRDAADRGIKIVLVTHDIGQARRLARDVAFLHRGRVVERGPAADLLHAPASAEAKAYLGHEIVI